MQLRFIAGKSRVLGVFLACLAVALSVVVGRELRGGKATAKSKPLPVRVIGGGPSGVFTAKELTSYIRYASFSKLLILLQTATPRTKEAALKHVNDHFEKLHGVTFSEDDVVMYKDHHYMPRASTEELESGFYDEFESLQGRDGLYIVSGLNDFELVENCYYAAIHVVDTYFKHPNQSEWREL